MHLLVTFTRKCNKFQVLFKGVYLKQQRDYQLLNNCSTESIFQCTEQGSVRTIGHAACMRDLRMKTKLNRNSLKEKATSWYSGVYGMIILKCILKQIWEWGTDSAGSCWGLQTGSFKSRTELLVFITDGKLIEGQAPINIRIIIYVSSETPQAGPRVLHWLYSTHRKLSYCRKGPPANCHILLVTTHHLLSLVVSVHILYRSSGLNWCNYTAVQIKSDLPCRRVN